VARSNGHAHTRCMSVYAYNTLPAITSVKSVAPHPDVLTLPHAPRAASRGRRAAQRVAQKRGAPGEHWHNLAGVCYAFSLETLLCFVPFEGRKKMG
jgi:hypothetical protein